MAARKTPSDHLAWKLDAGCRNSGSISMSSLIESIIEAQIPTLLKIFGERLPTIHKTAAGVSTARTVILESKLEPAGDYGERMEMETTIETAASDGAAVGDTWTITPATGSPATWKAEQILADDGLMRSFRARRVTP
jgi:hypothetical protein